MTRGAPPGPTASPAPRSRARSPSAQYAARLRERLREFTRVQVFGEVFGFKAGRARVCFELRDGAGALPCSMWRKDWDALGLARARRRRAGRRRRRLRLLPRLAHLLAAVLLRGHRRAHRRRGRPARPARAAAPRAARRGAVRAAEAAAAPGAAARRSASSPARAARRATTCSPACAAAAGPAGSCGRSRRCRTATPRRDHARAAGPRGLRAEVEVIVVARGGGSLADLFAFCDETLCRTVAMLRVPVISSVGHHTDRTLIDDVAAVACSTPTHAAEAAVPVDCAAARAALRAQAARLERQSARAIVERARTLAGSRARRPTTSRATARGCTSSCASCGPRARRVVAEGERANRRRAAALERNGRCGRARARQLETLALALAAHDPQRTLERGYALVEAADGSPVTSAAGRRRRAGARPAHARRRRPGPSRGRRTLGAMSEIAVAPTYESACARIEAIIARLDSGEAGLRETLELCQEGRDARRVLRGRARGRRPGARGAPPRRARRAAGDRPGRGSHYRPGGWKQRWLCWARGSACGPRRAAPWYRLCPGRAGGRDRDPVPARRRGRRCGRSCRPRGSCRSAGSSSSSAISRAIASSSCGGRRSPASRFQISARSTMGVMHRVDADQRDAAQDERHHRGLDADAGRSARSPRRRRRSGSARNSAGQDRAADAVDRRRPALLAERLAVAPRRRRAR